MTTGFFDFKPGGWRTVSLDHLVFPKNCCGCNKPTKSVQTFKGEAKASVIDVMSLFAGVEHSVSLSVPFCDSCRQFLSRKKFRAAVGAMILGATLGILVASIVPLNALEQTAMILARGGIITALGLLGFFAGYNKSGGQPLTLRRYSPDDQTVQIWFSNPTYRKEFEKLDSSQEDSSKLK